MYPRIDFNNKMVNLEKEKACTNNFDFEIDTIVLIVQIFDKIK